MVFADPTRVGNSTAWSQAHDTGLDRIGIHTVGLEADTESRAKKIRRLVF